MSIGSYELTTEEQIMHWLNGSTHFGHPFPKQTMKALGPKQLVETSEAFLGLLRGIVDAWISSGRDGFTDSPIKRSLEAPVPGVQNRPLRDILQGYLERNPLRFTVNERVAFTDFSHKFNVNEHLFSAKELAIYWFMHMLRSPTADRLAKCDYCGIYFCHERNPRRKDGGGPSRNNGTFCRGHGAKGGILRVYASLMRRREQMIAWAAESWPEWTERKKLPRPKWVAARVNKKIGSEWGHIGGRWVSQHQKAIEDFIDDHSVGGGAQ